MEKSFIIARSGENILGKKYVLAGVPGEMQTIDIDKSKANGEIIVEVQNNG